MSNINNLINKIISDAEKESKSIIDDANHKADEIINKKINEANIESARILQKGKIEIESKKERIVSNAKLKVRNEKLKAKQQIIQKVYDEALNRLVNIAQDEFLSFIKNSIEQLPIDGDELLIVNNTDKQKITEEFINELNEILIKKGKKGKIKLSNEDGNMQGGFILKKNGIEINNSFEALIDFYKDTLQTEIVDILFR